MFHVAPQSQTHFLPIYCLRVFLLLSPTTIGRGNGKSHAHRRPPLLSEMDEATAKSTILQMSWQYIRTVVLQFLAEEGSQYPFWASKVRCVPTNYGSVYSFYLVQYIIAICWSAVSSVCTRLHVTYGARAAQSAHCVGLTVSSLVLPADSPSFSAQCHIE